jgi:hypothetical protein
MIKKTDKKTMIKNNDKNNIKKIINYILIKKKL